MRESIKMSAKVSRIPADRPSITLIGGFAMLTRLELFRLCRDLALSFETYLNSRVLKQRTEGFDRLEKAIGELKQPKKELKP